MHSGTIELEPNQDYNLTFEPKVLPKHQLIITDQFEDIVISLYAKGGSACEIADYIIEMYAMTISATEISRTTDKVMPAMKE